MNVTEKFYKLQSLNFLFGCKFKVGILGGSFNPPHLGHLHLTSKAIKLLNLDFVIWLIAKQNPLKAQYDNSSLQRAEACAKLVNSRKIIISTIEDELNYSRTYDVLKFLINRFNTNRFIWLMGIDSIENYHKWYRYIDTINLCNFAIFDRPCESRLYNNSLFHELAKLTNKQGNTTNIAFYRQKLCDVSSTKLKG